MLLNNSNKQGDVVVGLKRAVVKDLNDPDKLNRVKVTLIDEVLELPFADIMVRSANKESGTVEVPIVGEEVIVGFLDGKINDPIILGSVFNSKTQPSFKIDSKANDMIVITFPMGLNIQMSSKQDKENLTITTKKGHVISVDDGTNEVAEVKEKSGKTSFKIDFKGGEIAIKAQKKISLTAGEDSLIVEAQKGVKVSSSGGKLEASVNSVALSATSNIECKANAKFVAQGSGGAELNSTGQAVVKGSITKVG